MISKFLEWSKSIVAIIFMLAFCWFLAVALKKDDKIAEGATEVAQVVAVKTNEARDSAVKVLGGTPQTPPSEGYLVDFREEALKFAHKSVDYIVNKFIDFVINPFTGFLFAYIAYKYLRYLMNEWEFESSGEFNDV